MMNIENNVSDVDSDERSSPTIYFLKKEIEHKNVIIQKMNLKVNLLKEREEHAQQVQMDNEKIIKKMKKQFSQLLSYVKSLHSKISELKKENEELNDSLLRSSSHNNNTTENSDVQIPEEKDIIPPKEEESVSFSPEFSELLKFSSLVEEDHNNVGDYFERSEKESTVKEEKLSNLLLMIEKMSEMIKETKNDLKQSLVN